MLIDELNARKAYYEKALNYINKHPINVKGRLRHSKHGSRYFYYVEADDKVRTYINQSQYDMVSKIVNRDYRNSMKKSLRRKLSAINAAIKAESGDPVNEAHLQLHESRRPFVSPLFQSDEEYAEAWSKKDYVTKGCDSDLTTKRGEHVRSKTERYIADYLYDHNIPYRYEPELILSDGRVIHPDFVILNIHTRKEYILEHLGMMDDNDYVTGVVKRIIDYEANGYFIGDNLLLTYETASMPLGERQLQGLIKKYLV